MRFYPPLFFNRIVVHSLSSDFKKLKVVVKKSIFNKNPQGGIFGGTLFSGADPYPAVQYWNIFRSKGIQCQVWLKNSEIDFLKPAKSNVYYEFILSDESIQKAESELREFGRTEIIHRVEGKDRDGIVITSVRSLTVMKIKSLD
jgi:Domain of unknown function (DUF4442)